MVTDYSCFCYFDIHCDFFILKAVLSYVIVTQECFQVCSLMVLYKFRLSFSHIVQYPVTTGGLVPSV